MKVILQDDNYFVLRFDKGEEVFTALTAFLQAQSINACCFSGIGACSEVELAYYNPHTKEYRKKPFFEELELLSLIGSGGLKDGAVALHAHAVLAKNDFATIGGHVFKLVISATCELFLTKLDGALERKLDAETNLNLLV